MSQIMQVFPPEILALKGSSMAFRIAIRKQQFHNMHNAFGVMQILNDPALVDAHCPELLEDSENEDNDKQLLDAEDDEEEFVSDDEVQSPITQQDSAKDFTQSGSGPVKRNVLDEFSSTQTSKKTKEATIKKEKLS
nr:replication factor A protein 1-like [Ipomoea batatas]GMD81042.1 replication factor A protein 1-like [Ipomoea batatas]